MTETMKSNMIDFVSIPVARAVADLWGEEEIGGDFRPTN